MALIHLRYWSAALGLQTSMYVALPQTPGPHPVIYQLHGQSDDYSIWLRRTTIELHAERIGVIVAMLEGGRGFYTNKLDGTANWESHILDSIAIVDRMFKTRPNRSGRAIGGLSMGGYGACKIGLKHPHLFASVVSHSGALDIRGLYTRFHDAPSMMSDLRAAFGESVAPHDDLFSIASSASGLPRLSIDCGVDDFLIEDNRGFHLQCLKAGIEHHYAEFPGGHAWSYWEQRLEASFDFHRAAFAAADSSDADGASRAPSGS